MTRTIYNAETLEMMDIKDGGVLLIEPLDRLPNFERKIVTQGVSDEGIYYGATETSDGKLYPFWAIKSIKKVKSIKKENDNE